MKIKSFIGKLWILIKKYFMWETTGQLNLNFQENRLPYFFCFGNPQKMTDPNHNELQRCSLDTTGKTGKEKNL